jgi:tetratricopeptide (TPR) repeat protein
MTNLLSRAVALLEDDHERGELLMHLAAAAIDEGDFPRATALYDEVKAAARRAQDDLLEMRAELEWLQTRQLIDPEMDQSEMLSLANRVDAMAIERGEPSGRIAAEFARAEAYLMVCRWMDELAALERARELLDPVDDPGPWRRCHVMICNSLRWGPVPAEEAIERIQAMSWESGTGSGRVGFTAALHAMLGQFDEAREEMRSARTYLEEHGMRMRVADSALQWGTVEDLAGHLEAADRVVGDGIEILRSMGETGVLSTLAGMHAAILYRLGRRQEAEASVLLAQETGAPQDIATQVGWRVVAAQLDADEGRLAEAERTIGEAIELIEPTDFLELRGATFDALAHVEARAGRPDAWRAALERALAEHDRKGNLVSAGRIREQLAAGPPEPVASA